MILVIKHTNYFFYSEKGSTCVPNSIHQFSPLELHTLGTHSFASFYKLPRLVNLLIIFPLTDFFHAVTSLLVSYLIVKCQMFEHSVDDICLTGWGRVARVQNFSELFQNDWFFIWQIKGIFWVEFFPKRLRELSFPVHLWQRIQFVIELSKT